MAERNGSIAFCWRAAEGTDAHRLYVDGVLLGTVERDEFGWVFGRRLSSGWKVLSCDSADQGKWFVEEWLQRRA
jgi:hypothetical protein